MAYLKVKIREDFVCNFDYVIHQLNLKVPKKTVREFLKVYIYHWFFHTCNQIIIEDEVICDESIIKLLCRVGFADPAPDYILPEWSKIQADRVALVNSGKNDKRYKIDHLSDEALWFLSDSPEYQVGLLRD